MKNQVMLQMKKPLTLFALTMPIFVEMFLNMLMGTADTFMLSKHSDEAVAAVGIANQILFLVMVIFGFITVGTSILIAQSLGGGKKKEANEIAVVSLVANIAFGFALSAILFFGSETILSLMNIDRQLMGIADVYLKIVGSFSFLQAAMLTIGAVIRSHGFTRDAMYVAIWMNVIHVAGNYIVLFGPFGLPVLGVEGVAYSTAISRLFGAALLGVLLFKRVKGYLPFKEVLQLPKAHLQNLLKIGLPAAGEQLSYNLSQFVILYFITTIGTEAVTTRVYTTSIMQFIFLGSAAIAQGTQIIIGYHIGAGQFELAYKRCMKSLKIGIIISFSAALVFSVCAKFFFSLFTGNEHIILLGSTLIMITVLLEPGRAFNMIIISSLRATGDSRFAFVIGVLSMWGISVALSYVLGIHYGLGLIGIWFSFVADEWLRGILVLARWRSRIWVPKVFAQEKASA